MLDQVEHEVAKPHAPVIEVSQAREWRRPVWVYSKSQPPYPFRPWTSVCSPPEWPYNLQALRGSTDYDDILAWYCERHPKVSRSALDHLIEEVIRSLGDRQISVEIFHDMETRELSPWFHVWGFQIEPTGEEEALMATFNRRWHARTDLRPLRYVVHVSAGEGAFEDRRLSNWS